MNKNTKDTADISFVAFVLVVVIAAIITCGILVATPFLIKWIVELLLVLGESFITIF